MGRSFKWARLRKTLIGEEELINCKENHKSNEIKYLQGKDIQRILSISLKCPTWPIKPFLYIQGWQFYRCCLANINQIRNKSTLLDYTWTIRPEKLVRTGPGPFKFSGRGLVRKWVKNIFWLNKLECLDQHRTKIQNIWDKHLIYGFNMHFVLLHFIINMTWKQFW